MRRRAISRAMILVAAAAGLALGGETAGQPVYAPYLNRASVELRGTYRDFGLYYMPGGHPDFGAPAAMGAGRYANVPGNLLDTDGKPVMLGGGHRVQQPQRDGLGRPIIFPRGYIGSMAGDVAGTLDEGLGRTVADSSSYWAWFRNVPGVNQTELGTVRLDRLGGGDAFIFEGRVDRGGALTSSAERPENALYTYEIDTIFVYEEGSDWYLTMSGGGDMWAFIDDMLVIDAAAGSGFTGAHGIVADGRIIVENTGDVWVAPGATGSVCTNATDPGAVTVSNSGVIRTDVYAGPGANVGAAIDSRAAGITGQRGSLGAQVVMPQITVPDVGPSVGNLSYTHHAYQIAQSLRCNHLSITTQAEITIVGNVSIVCDGDFELRNKCKIILAPDATLELYVRGSIFMGQQSEFNVSTADPFRATIYSLGSSPVDFDNVADIYANIAAPRAELQVGNAVHVRGNFIGASFRLRNTGDFTIMGGGAWGSAGGMGAPAASQTIRLSRLGWLLPGRTYSLRMFYADRDLSPSRLRVETNINTLNIAAPPKGFSGD